MAKTTESPVALVGGTLVELFPPRCERADVVLADGRISQVGGEAPAGAVRVDAEGCIVMPALAVGHTHLYSALACGMPPGPMGGYPPYPRAIISPSRFVEILERVWWRLDRALDLELIHVSALVGAVEAARRGVGFVIDHHASPEAIDGSLDRIAAALDEVGLRGALCYETTDRGGPERRKAGLRENERFVERARAGETAHAALVGAHAPFTLEDETLAALRDMSARHSVGVHVHVAEDTTDGLDAVTRKTTLDARLERMGVGRPGSIVAHGVHLEPASVAALMRAGAWIVTNCRSNMNNAVGLSSAEGTRLALGTDGIGADMLAEAHAHFLRHTEAGDGLASASVERLVGAQRLAALVSGEGEKTPRIAVGERADLAVLAYEPMTPMTANNLSGHVLFAWSSARVRDTLVGGRFVMRDRTMVSIDEKELAARARSAAARLWKTMDALPDVASSAEVP
jgi:cytosine/adenosine deaminase-related metal-dependent hydrolase